MLHRFLHNKTAVGTVTIVLIVAFMGLLPHLLLHMIPMPPIFLTNLPISAKNIPLAQIILGAVFSPA